MDKTAKQEKQEVIESIIDGINQINDVDTLKEIDKLTYDLLDNYEEKKHDG